MPGAGLVLVRGAARFRVVRIGGPEVRKVRGNIVDPIDGRDVHLYRDSSIAPLLDLRRRVKVVGDVLGEMVRSGFSSSRFLELTAQWNCVLEVRLVHRISAGDLVCAQGVGLGWFHEVVCALHGRLSDFVHRVVVMRRDDANRSWRNWLREDPLVRPYRWLRPELVLPAPFCSVILALLLVVLGSGMMRNSEKLGFPIFVALGKGKKAWRLNSMRRLRVGCLCPLTGDDFLEAVKRKTATAGSLDGWSWRELKSLPDPWFAGLARILTKGGRAWCLA